MFQFSLGGETIIANASEFAATCEALIARHGGVPTIVPYVAPVVETVTVPAVIASPVEAHQIAKHRTVHNARRSFQDVAAELTETIRAERRIDVKVTAGEFAKRLSVNGALKFDGLKLNERAIRGLLARIDSPSLSYVLGLRERIATELNRGDAANRMAILSDKATILRTVQYECERNANMKLMLRTRDGIGDVFAIVSPSYGVCDAPTVIESLRTTIGSDTKCSAVYNAASTGWSIEASMFDPSPIVVAKVGEPFEAFTSVRGRDGGNGSVIVSGGTRMLSCLNGMTKTVACDGGSRVHRGSRVDVDVRSLLRESASAIETMCGAIGIAREQVVDVTGMTLEQAIPGLFRYMLSAPRGELVGVLPGRTDEHVRALAAVYPSERRDHDRVVRADLAQAYSKYSQSLGSDVQREAEGAIGEWLVKAPRLLCDVKGAS